MDNPEMSSAYEVIHEDRVNISVSNNNSLRMRKKLLRIKIDPVKKVVY